MLSCVVFAASSEAIPAVAYPFNSQVPYAARVGEGYNYQFPASTFVPDAANFTYSLSGGPGWLSLDGPTRTLSGIPSSVDAGSNSFTLTAADDTGSAYMPCALVVSSDPAPQIEWSVSEQLSATSNLSSSQPPVVTILPTTPFHFSFRHDSFIDEVQRELSYYATLSDHTPLPSWLTFNAEELDFSGTAPQLSAFPQSWSVDLIASDVPGFGGAAASFTLAIGTHQLAFVPEIQRVHISPDMPIEYSELSKTLFMNGQSLEPRELKNAQASLPAWLHFDQESLSIEGTAPSAVYDENATVTVNDKLGNTATALVLFSGSERPLFTGDVPNIRAYYGESFHYHFSDSLFTEQDVECIVTLPEQANWLHFDSSECQLSGTVPSKTDESSIIATVTAKTPSQVIEQSEVFTIHLQQPTGTTGTTKPHASTSSTQTSTLHPLRPFLHGPRHNLRNGAAIGIIVGTVAAAAIIVVVLVLCWRRRRKNESYVESVGPDKGSDARMPPPGDPGVIVVTSDVYNDVERNAGIQQGEPPPQIALNLPSQPTNKWLRWSKRASHVSQATSIGNGEDALLADSNIPVSGQRTTALHTPHHSYSVPADIARSSRLLSDQSPSKRTLRRLHNKRQPRQSIGLGIDTGECNFVPQLESLRDRGRKREMGSVGDSTRRDHSSLASFSTRGTSVLSTRPSEFPHPPLSSVSGGHRCRRSLGLTESEKRKSIRLVAPSESTLDTRSMQEKRRSFIRNRASTSLASPLFAHGSRAPSDPRQGGNSSIRGSVAGSNRRSRRGASQLTTYSESSSLEPPPRNPHRMSARMRSTFRPSFPRAITQSNLGVDDEGETEHGGASSAAWSTASSTYESDLATQLARPRSQRNFVLPGEASPTPPPAPPTSRQGSSGRKGMPRAHEDGSQRSAQHQRDHSDSPLSTAVAVAVSPLMDVPSGSKMPKHRTKNRRSLLSEPLSLVSSDSLSKNKVERPRLVQHSSSKRPVGLEKAERWSVSKTGTEDARPGSEMWEAMEGAGLMPRSVVEGRGEGEGTGRSGKSNMSGPAFI